MVGNGFQKASRVMYFLATGVLMLFALVFIGVAAYSVFHSLLLLDIEATTHGLLDGVGMIVLAIAVFEIAKYLYEEELEHDRELRHADEARRTLTKFLTTIIIAASLEGLVLVFEARTSQMSDMVYPAILLMVIVFMVLGLGLYQLISRRAETIDPKEGDS
ncbi:hypothetical protein GAY33_25005 [Azospirillum brasilense]|uniref:GNAT family acetyltransferase n=4 Tax=Azospirillum TaxID=191 RepID=A0A2K1FW64_9PROT|nr:hypothetical protein [Azospirillum argentinense]NUB05604.1 hypothetical protein [Azospirillum baldaniorum]PNQ96795.1 hypothetical protein C1S70_21220 [Azospirillum argentinense]QCN93945.1 hypothetical protein D3093_00895 [Azospirillum argentinense]QCO01143.1 hypothetical protein D3867_03180 [Azospirillum argentinense]